MTAAPHEQLQRVFLEACDLGPGDRTAFLDRACEYKPEFRGQVEALLAADADSGGLIDKALSKGGAKVLANAMAVSGELDRPEIKHPDQIGRYRILRVIGQGGMGIVYEAEQDDPKRRVALKVVRPDAITRTLLHRFRHETQVLGHLQHPGIAQIYEAGTAKTPQGDQSFFAMELVEGQTLRQHATTHELSIADRLELIASLCDIIQYAHQRGVIHRDLKPANILITEDYDSSSSLHRDDSTPLPRPRLKVLDFGVARITDADLQTATLQTTMGQLIGTVPYMSPEQASGDPAQIDTRSDVYAIGLILCELLTGRLPYDIRGKLVHEAVRMIQEDDPSSLSTTNPALRGDVETIVFKALEKDKERRYQSAAELAADIRRYLSNQPIEARPASVWYQTRKFARRNRTLVAGVLATLLVTVAGSVTASRYAVIASARATQMERASYISGIAAAMSAIEQHDHTTAASFLDQTPEPHRGWEYDYLRAQLVGHVKEWSSPGHIMTPLMIDGQSRLMSAAILAGSQGRWELGTWELAGDQPIDSHTIGTALAPFSQIVPHAASNRYAARNTLGDIVVGSMLNPEEHQVVSLHQTENAIPIAWDRDGERLVFTDTQTRLWDGHSSRVLAETPAWSADFSPSGDRVAITQRDTITLHDPESGATLARISFDDHLIGLSFSPDGETIAASGVYRNLYLLDAYSLELITRLGGHQDMVFAPAWSADGTRLATVSSDSTLRIWDTSSHKALAVHQTEMSTYRMSVTILDDTVYVASDRVRSFPLSDPAVLRGHESYIYHLAFSPDGSMIASSGYLESEIRLWEVRSRKLLTTFPAPKTYSMAQDTVAAPNVQFSADSRRLVVCNPFETWQWDVRTGEALEVPVNPDPTEQFLETLGHRSLVRISPTHVRGPAGGRIPEDTLGGWPEVSPTGLDVSHDGKRVAIAQFDGDVSVFPAGSTTPIGTLIGHTGIAYCVAFSPDGSRIATGGNDTTVRIWDAHTFEQLLVLRGHTQYVKAISFTPDGSAIASASGDHTIRLWDTNPGSSDPASTSRP